MASSYNRHNDTQEQRFQRDLLSYEKEQDFLKHLATLDTGSVLLLVTFYEKFSPKLEWKVLIGLAFVFFIISLLGCLVMQFLSLLHMDGQAEDKEFGFNIQSVLVIAGFGGFLGGISVLTAFAIKNLY